MRAPTFEFISIIGQTSFTVTAKDNQNTDIGLAAGETLHTLGGVADITGPVRTGRWVASTEDVTRLPKSGDRYDIEADTIADGYADDNPDTTDIDGSVNRAQTNPFPMWTASLLASKPIQGPVGRGGHT